MSKVYRVCLIGCGRMGATIDDEIKGRFDSSRWQPYSHAAAYTSVESTELVAVSDVMQDKVEAAQKRYNVPAGYTDYREMIEKEEPDIVSIATRPGTHAEMTVFAAEHGVKGIYCEKPLCCSMEEADLMVEACEKNGVKFNYGTQRRYADLYHKARGLIEAGEIGKLQCVVAECGLGAAQWSHTHASDMLLYLAGDPEIDFVQGTVNVSDDAWEGNNLPQDPGISNGYVRFKNGVHGYFVAGGAYEFEAVGSSGRVRTLNNGLGGELWKAQGKWNVQKEAVFPKATLEVGTNKCVEDLVNAIENDTDTQGNVYLARRSQEMILGIIESHRQGGVRVTLPMQNRSLYVGKKDW